MSSNEIGIVNEFFKSGGMQPKNFKLLYRASENDFKAAVFHKKCDNIPNTFTMAKTEFGRILGGFTPLTW